MSKVPKQTKQSEAFIDTAKALGCDEDEAHFEEALKKVARHKAPPDKPAEPKQPKPKKPGQ